MGDIAQYQLPLALSAEGLSFVACGLLIYGLSSLGDTARSRLFPRQMVQLAAANIVFGIGSTLQDVQEFGQKFNADEGLWSGERVCRYWSGIPYKFGRTVTVLTEVHIAISFTCAAAQADRTFPYLFASLRWLWPLGFIVSIIEVAYLEHRLKYDSLTYACALTDKNWVAISVLLLSFSAMLAAYAMLLFRAREVGGQMLTAALRSVVYPLVFVVSFSVILVVYLAAPSFNSGLIYLIAQCLQHCNGFLNMVAYLWCSHHAWRLSEGRVMASLIAPWVDQWAGRATTPNAAASTREPPAARGDSRLLLHLNYLEGGGTLEAAPTRSTTGGKASGTEMLPGTAGGERAGRPPLSAFVWQRSAGSLWPRLELAPALFEQAFQPVKSLGAGSFGSVVLATARADFGDVKQGQSYAVKFIRAAAGQMARYAYQERDLLRSLDHPGIVRLHEALRLEPPSPSWVLVMEFCPGGDLSRKVASVGKPGMEASMALQYAAEILDALVYLHAKKVMHRDLKPGNILLTATGRAKIADFGLATSGSRAHTRAGSYGYLAPEVMIRSSDPYGPSADLYSFGRVVEFMLTARLHSDPAAGVRGVKAPEEMVQLITQTTNLRPQERGKADELRAHPCFVGIDWDSLYKD